MTTTADWLHLRFGRPLVEVEADEVDSAGDAICSEADVVALQKAYAVAPLMVQFVGR
jgi:hypothetical protein